MARTWHPHGIDMALVIGPPTWLKYVPEARLKHGTNMRIDMAQTRHSNAPTGHKPAWQAWH